MLMQTRLDLLEIEPHIFKEGFHLVPEAFYRFKMSSIWFQWRSMVYVTGPTTYTTFDFFTFRRANCNGVG